jgi:hypothetical protein
METWTMTSLSKKRGRPLGSKNKPAPEGMPFKPNFSSADKARVVLLQKSNTDLKKRVDELELIRDNMHRVIDNQEHKAVQYQAVIDYLEHLIMKWEKK